MPPAVTLCPRCKLAYNVEKNPTGCPHCKANPALAGIMQQAQREEEQQRDGMFAQLVELWSLPLTKIAVAAVAVVLFVLTYSLVLGRSQQHIENLQDTRRHLYERGCAFAGVEGATPAMTACVTFVEGQCSTAAPADVERCAEAAARGQSGTPP